jgi:hypothetical protein
MSLAACARHERARHDFIPTGSPVRRWSRSVARTRALNHTEENDKMKSRILRYLFTAFAATGLFTALLGSSQARSLPAFMGQPQNPFDYTCFLNGGGTVRNNCSVTKEFCVGLPVDTSYHAVEVTVSPPDRDHNITCGAETRCEQPRPQSRPHSSPKFPIPAGHPRRRAPCVIR